MDHLNHWPDKVKLMHKNWIGRSEGCYLRYEILDGSHRKIDQQLEIFTTRPDTIFCESFFVISPMHLIAQKILEIDKIIHKFLND